MTEAPASRIRGMDPFDLVCVARRFMRSARGFGIDLPAAHVVPDRLRPSYLTLRPLLASEMEREAALPADVALEVASASLAVVEADAALRPLLERAVDEQARDESMSAVEILTVGVAASLILAVATTEFEWRDGRLRNVRKRALGDEALIRLAGVLERVVSRRGERGVPHAPSGGEREAIRAHPAGRPLTPPEVDEGT